MKRDDMRHETTIAPPRCRFWRRAVGWRYRRYWKKHTRPRCCKSRDGIRPSFPKKRPTAKCGSVSIAHGGLPSVSLDGVYQGPNTEEYTPELHVYTYSGELTQQLSQNKHLQSALTGVAQSSS